MSNGIIFLIVGAVVFGIIIGWLFSKSKSGTRVAELQTKLNGSEQSLHNALLELKELNGKTEGIQKELGDVQQSRAALTNKVDMLSDFLIDNKSRMQTSTNELESRQTALTEALEAKAKAETTSQESKRAIGELQKREDDLNTELEELRRQLTVVKESNATLEATLMASKERLDEQQTFMESAQKNLKDAFGALSAEALKGNNVSFVELANAKLQEKVTEAKGELEKKEQAIGELVKPLSESLKNMDLKIQDLEVKRIKAYSDIWNILDNVKTSTEGLKKETTNLVGALKTSHTRGRYGEIALRRLVEHAGMFEHCDFEEQVTVEDEESGRLRPDMIIKLPGNKTFVVDSKTPLAAYLKMFETEDPDQQRALLTQHVSAVKEHFRKLSAKAYWSQFSEAPDFVIMYMHIESSYGVALQAWPEMIEEAMKNRIIVATPTILLAILLGVGYSWNQLKTMENIEAIRDAAVELHDRSAVLIEHIASIGRSLNITIGHYNKTIGSLEASFLPQTRRINALSQAYVKKQEIPEILPIETSVRPITAASQLPNKVDDRDVTDLEVV